MENAVRRGAVRDEIRRAERESRSFRKSSRNRCEHRPQNGEKLQPLEEAIVDNRLIGINPNDYPEGTVRCDACGDIFTMREFTREDLQDIIFDLKSIFSQIKVLADLRDDEYASIVRIADFIDENLESQVFQFYLGMTKQLGEKRKKNKGKKETPKGGFNKDISIKSSYRR